MLGDSLGAGIVYHLSKDELDDFGKPPTKSVLSHLTLHLSEYSPSLEKILDKTCARHADGGFESVPMTDAEENGHPGK